jgi:4-diphosphocytidyl-2-C-methyl-D-erythritol kinase
MTPEPLSEVAYAKINLALHVRARLPNGYHRLEALFAFGDQGDVVTAKAADEITLSISGPCADGLSGDRDNLVMQAAHALSKAAGVSRGAQLHLDKRLPIASGIGGGSADAAATLRVLNRLWRLSLSEVELENIGRSLGADVPACVRSVTCRGTGVGDELTLVDGRAIAGLGLLLVNPRISVSTAAIFADWNGIDQGGLAQGDDLLLIARQGRNDLTSAAVKQAPSIADIIDFLAAQHPLLTRMSGSGATCFALFDTPDRASQIKADLSQKWPEYWSMSCLMR